MVLLLYLLVFINKKYKSHDNQYDIIVNLKIYDIFLHGWKLCHIIITEMFLLWIWWGISHIYKGEVSYTFYICHNFSYPLMHCANISLLMSSFSWGFIFFLTLYSLLRPKCELLLSVVCNFYLWPYVWHRLGLEPIFFNLK